MSRRETAITTIPHPEPIRVTVGVDTHGDLHVACALDQLGRHLAITRVATTPRGYRAVLAWAQSLGEVDAWGVEGTGCYGAGLVRFLAAQGQMVWEVITGAIKWVDANFAFPQLRRLSGHTPWLPS